MLALDPNFRPLLKNHTFDDLQAHAGSIFGLWPDLRLAYFNPTWFQFAEQNGGEPAVSARFGLGASILDAISGEIRDVYRLWFEHALQTGRPWHHVYECSSEDIYRKFHQISYPLGAGEGWLVVNSLLVEEPLEGRPGTVELVDEVEYRDENGLIHQCAHCRRVKYPRMREEWHWVSEWVKWIPKKTSHTFCPGCFGYYYPLPSELGE